MIARSLRVKSVAVLVAMSFVPLGVVGALSIRESRARIFDDETALLAARADQLVAALDHFNQEYQRAIARLARAPEVIELLAGGEDEPSPSVLAAELDAHADGDAAIEALGLLDRTGRVRAATAAQLIGTDHGARGYVQDGLRGVASTSDPYVTERGTAMIAYAAPVIAGRRPVGVAVFWVRAEALWDVARRFNGLAGDGSFAVVFDRHGIRIAHTFSREIVFHPAGALPEATTQRLVAEQRFGATTAALLGDVRPFPAQFARARAAYCDPGLFHGFAPVDPQVDYGVGRRLSSAAWTAFYMVPRATLAAPIASLTIERAIVTIAVAIAALVIGALLAAMLVRPLRGLAAATAAVARGDLTVRVAADRRDELGELGRAFNAMSAQLEQQVREVGRVQDNLELLVGRRTAELAASVEHLRALASAKDDALRAQQAALAQGLQEREILLQEVHHRVNNNLQVISSLINLQARKLEDGSARDALAECQTRLFAITLIHERPYQSKDYSHVRFSDYVRSLAGNVFHATGTSPANIALELAIDEIPLGVDRAVPCGLLLNELITNALKHGFKDGRAGRIRVELVALDGGWLRLIVDDDGVGLPAGFDVHAVESMGLQLVRTLAGQLDAELVIGGAHGASFQLTFARATGGASESGRPAARPVPAPRRGRILVVDDEPLVLRAMKRVLRDHDATLVDNAREAAALVAAGEAYDVIFSDVMMPQMTGIELYEHLLADRPDVARRVVFLTGGVLSSPMTDFLAAVPNVCLQKPIVVSTLRAFVRQRLSGE